LRKLRTLLGVLLDKDKPVRQDDFAGLIGVPLPTVRAIEAGRRQLNWENSLRYIDHWMGVQWVEREWVMTERYGSD
jgi:hypothetical protein